SLGGGGRLSNRGRPQQYVLDRMAEGVGQAAGVPGDRSRRLVRPGGGWTEAAEGPGRLHRAAGGCAEGPARRAITLTRSTIQQLRLLAFAVAISAAIGAVYSAVETPPEVPWAVRVLVGAIIGAIISACIIGFDLFGAERIIERGGRRPPLAVAILVRAAGYGIVIMAALLLVPWLIRGESPSPFRPGILNDAVFS